MHMYSWLFRFAATFLILALLLAIFGYGIAVQRFKLPPYKQLTEIETAIRSIKNTVSGKKEWYFRPATDKQTNIVEDNRPEPHQPGLNLVTAIITDNRLSISIIDMSGNTVHQWLVDWFELVPDDSYLLESERPKDHPGTQIHGTVVMPNGDVIFNFEKKALIRLAPDGSVVWRQQHLTHHSLEIGPDGYLWAPLKLIHPAQPDPRFIDLKPSYEEELIARIDPDTGEILEQFSLYEILIENDLRSLLYLGRGDPLNRPTGDLVHLNDVEVFHGSATPGLFKRGDIMVSMRNISTILVFDPVTREVRYRLTADNFINQHDPDFIDSNHISIFDNNPIGNYTGKQQSRILLADAREGSPKILYAGTESDSKPFFTDRMGKHQWLDNGHILITDTAGGRSIEIDKNGTIVWEYLNLVDGNMLGSVWQVDRLPKWSSEIFRR
jgi:hypothetical protein